MGFFKDTFSLIMFSFTYIFIFLLFLLVFYSYDNDKEGSYLIYHKCYFYYLLILIIWSHLSCSFTNPGKITTENNKQILEFYLTLHDFSIQKAKKFNQTYGEVFFKNIGEDDEEIKRMIDENSDNEPSEEDEKEFPGITTVEDKVMNKLKDEFQIKINRCSQCYCVRPPRSHHCASCHSCILKMDHHCPWINNCVGQFTQKFFILFCFYSLSGCFEALIIEFYYVHYKSHNLFNSIPKLIFSIFQISLTVIFFIFNFSMIKDQWNIMQDDTTDIDMKRKRFREKRDISEILTETFGCEFSFSWLFPIKRGGFWPFFRKFIKAKKRN